MKILRIKIENYRGVKSREVHFRPCGVTVLEGDNEVGKTSMAEAIDLLFDYLDSSGNKCVTAVQPVGRDVGSVVEIDVETGRYKFTYRKQFHRQRRTELTITSPHLEQLTGRLAHERVEKMLAETVDVPLWKALRFQQGVRIDQADLTSQTSLQAALDKSSASALGGEHENSLFDRVKDEYQSYWSKTGRPLARARELNKAETDSADEVQRCRAELDGLASTIERYARLEQDISSGMRQFASQTNQVANSQDHWHAVEALERSVDGLTTQLQLAQAEAAKALADVESRQLLIDRHDEASQLADLTELKLRQQSPIVAWSSQQLECALTERDRRDRDVTARRLRCDRATRDVEHLRDIAAVTRDTDRLSRHARAQSREVAAQQILDQNKVTPELLNLLTEAYLSWRQAEAHCAQDLPTVTLTGDGCIVRIDDTETTLGDEPLIVGVSRRSRLDIGDVRVEVTAGGNAEELGRAAAEARSAYGRLCSDAYIPDIEAARVSASVRATADAESRYAREQQTEALSNEPLESIQRTIAAAQTRIAAYLAARPAQPAIPASDCFARRVADDAQAAVAASETAQQQGHLDVEVARTSHERARHGDVAAQTRHEDATQQLDIASGALSKSRLLYSDEHLEHRAREAAAVLARCLQAHALAVQEYQAQDPDTLRIEQDNLEQVLADSTQTLQRDRHQLIELHTELEVRGEAGVAGQLDKARTVAVQAQNNRAAYTARADSTRLLYETMSRARTEARRAYVKPLEDKIQSLGRIVFGSTFAVELDSNLRIQSRTMQGQSIDFTSLSCGAREQLAVISRLACACLVSRYDGVPIILDDALGYSDPARLAAMGAVLALAGRECHVLILTCTPARYSGVGAATVISIKPERGAGLVAA